MFSEKIEWEELRNYLNVDSISFHTLFGFDKRNQFDHYRYRRREPTIEVWLRMKYYSTINGIELPDELYYNPNDYVICDGVKVVTNNLVELRRLLGLNQSEMAKKLGIIKSLLSAYELNQSHPKVSTALRIKYLALSKGIILDDSCWGIPTTRIRSKIDSPPQPIHLEMKLLRN